MNVIRHAPGELDPETWEILHQLSRDAFSQAFKPDRTQAEVDHFVNWHDQKRYYDSHTDPNIEVGKRLLEGQLYSDPVVAIAANDLGGVIGFGYGALNVSGVGNSKAKLALKRRLGKEYFWIREVVVHPDMQRQGIGRAILSNLVWGAGAKISTYVLSDSPDFVIPALRSVGFSETGSVPVHAFGEDQRPSTMTRLQAVTVTI